MLKQRLGKQQGYNASLISKLGKTQDYKNEFKGKYKLRLRRATALYAITKRINEKWAKAR